MGINAEFILARDKLRTLSPPRFLSPIETRRQFLLSLLIFGVPALGIGIAILWQRGLGEPSSTGDLIFTIIIAALAGVAEEVLFGGLAKRFFGNGGLVIARWTSFSASYTSRSGEGVSGGSHLSFTRYGM